MAKMRMLIMSNNQISGTITKGLQNMPSLQVLDFGSNNLSGSLPSGLGQLQQLELLYLDNNNFHGRLPSELQDLKELNQFIVGANDMTGPVPPLLFATQSINISNNRFDGSIDLPMNFPHFCSLDHVIFDLSENQLGGIFPWHKIQPPCAYYFNIAGNNFQGAIHSTSNSRGTEMLEINEFFNISGNRFTGRLPSLVTSEAHRTHSVIDLSDNDFEGATQGDTLEQLVDVDCLAMNDLQVLGTLPESVVKQNATLVSLSLRNASLHGTIPTTYGALTMLALLDLSNNNLVGSIPAGLEDLLLRRTLNGTDLSCNLAGTTYILPAQLQHKFCPLIILPSHYLSSPHSYQVTVSAVLPNSTFCAT
jgi:Leucine-rich repeat (LRR) protein